MGSGRFSADDYAAYTSSTYAGKTTADAFRAKTKSAKLDPTRFKNGMREARDNEDNPLSTPVAIFTDVTGSMGSLAQHIVLRALPTICSNIYDRRPVTDPQILVGAIGDAFCDTAPIQASQFEADAKLVAEQLRDLFIEGGGGANRGESYSMAHLFGAMQTSIDSFGKRGQKGFLFTIGDEPILGVPEAGTGGHGVTKDQAKRFMGLDLQSDMSAADILALCSQQWEVFHINVMVGAYPQESWKHLLGQRVLPCQDIDSLGEVIVSAIRVTAGEMVDTVASSWSGDKSIVVREAIKGLVPSGASAGGVARL